MKLTTSLDPTQYQRFFAFGCSFTDYYWSTWADIIGAHVPEYYNWGRSGQGNLYIALTMMEAHKRFRFGPSDLVIPMWSSVTREDRYFDNSWHGGGNIYTCREYTDAQKKAFIQTADTRAYLIRDLGLISYAQSFIESTGADWDFLAMVSPGELERDEGRAVPSDVSYHYADTFDSIKPSVYDAVAQRSWQTFVREGNDNHPFPLRHLEYLRTIYKHISISPKVESALEDEQQLWASRSVTYDSSLKHRVGVRTQFNHF